MTCGTRVRSSPTASGRRGDTDAEVRGEEGLVRAESEEVEALGGGKSRDARGVALEERAPALGPRDAPQGLARGYRRWTPWCPLAFGDAGDLRGRSRCERRRPLWRPPGDARRRRCSGRSTTSRDGARTDARRCRCPRVPRDRRRENPTARNLREGVARAGPGQTERRERRRARETRRRRATRALERARARSTHARHTSTGATQTVAQDVVECPGPTRNVRRNQCTQETICALTMVDRHARRERRRRYPIEMTTHAEDFERTRRSRTRSPRDPVPLAPSSTPRALPVPLPLDLAARFQQVSRDVVDHLEPIGAEVNAAVPSTHHHAHVRRARHLKEV